MTLLRSVHAVRHNVGLWRRDDLTVLECTGKDAGTWLHAQVTSDVLGLENGEGQASALLDRQGRVLASFSIHRWQQDYWLLIEKQQKQAVFDRIESHLFIEEVKVSDVAEGTPFFAVEGPRAVVLMARALGEDPVEAAHQLPRRLHNFQAARIEDVEVLVYSRSETGEEGFLVVPSPENPEAVYDRLQELCHAMLGEEVAPPALESLRVEAGLPRYGADIDASCVINETPLEQTSVSYDKGCYLGQEVVARMKAYGTPKRALGGLEAAAEAAGFPPPGSPLMVEGVRAGEVRSSAFSPTLNRWLALAYLDRNHRTPGTELHLDSSQKATVRALPFYQARSPQETARQMYDDALSLFEADVEDEDPEALRLLEEAVILAPDFEDAHEALGVILHRHGRTEEAIRRMKHLASLNPHNVMVHTNLSRFYVALGMKQEAEEEKALAEQLEHRRLLDREAAEAHAQREREGLRQQARERIEMFREVLEFDPEDPVATMGMGRSLMMLEQYAEAVPYLERATQVKKDYSAAFLELGKCHEYLHQDAEAVKAYEEGIAAASRKGDLMPLREMERRTKALRD